MWTREYFMLSVSVVGQEGRYFPFISPRGARGNPRRGESELSGRTRRLTRRPRLPRGIPLAFSGPRPVNDRWWRSADSGGGMIRLVVALYLMIVTAVGPAACCCTFSRLGERPAEKPSAPAQRS